MRDERSLAPGQSVAHPEAEAHELQVEQELKAQFVELRRQAVVGQFEN